MVNLLKLLFRKSTKRVPLAAGSFLLSPGMALDSPPPSPKPEQKPTLNRFRSFSDTLPIIFETSAGTFDAIFIAPPTLSSDGRIVPARRPVPRKKFTCYATICEAPNCPEHGKRAQEPTDTPASSGLPYTPHSNLSPIAPASLDPGCVPILPALPLHAALDIPSLPYTIDSALSGLFLGSGTRAGLAYPDTPSPSPARIPPSMHYASTKRSRLRRAYPISPTRIPTNADLYGTSMPFTIDSTVTGLTLVHNGQVTDVVSV